MMGPVLLGILACRSACADAGQTVETNDRPNIIFILADDLGYSDVGCYGQQRIMTPSLDRMAAEGLRFTDAYAGAPVCAPSRCVLMTGLHGGHARIRGNVPATQAGASLVANDVTIAEVLKEAGYSTGVIGKWGLGEPTNNEAGLPRRQGFDYFFGYLKHGEAHNYFPARLWRNESLVRLRNVIAKNPGANQHVATKKLEYSHDLFAEEALKFVRETRGERFFLYLAFTIPHANDEAGDKGMEAPDYGQYASLPWPEPQKGHAAMITRMDRDIGRLFVLLRELDLDEKTLVVFASDNGPHHEGGVDPEFNDSNGPLRGVKGGVTEGGIRVPMIVRWPGRAPAGATSDSPVTFADMMPTLASLGGAKASAGLDGTDITPTILGTEQPGLFDRFLYWEFYKHGVVAQSSRWNKWKAIRDPRSKTIELYDLETDIGESNNVAASHPDIVSRFQQYFNAARAESPRWPVRAAAARQASDGTGRTPQS